MQLKIGDFATFTANKIGDFATFLLLKTGDFANFAANKYGDFADGCIQEKDIQTVTRMERACRRKTCLDDKMSQTSWQVNCCRRICEEGISVVHSNRLRTSS